MTTKKPKKISAEAIRKKTYRQKTKLQKDKKLFEDVDKYLYDTPKRTRITMAWVSANCDVVKEKLMKKVEKLIDELTKKYCFCSQVMSEQEGEPCMVCSLFKELKQKLRELK